MTADDVIGKLLIAEQDVPLRQYASSSAPVVGVVTNGSSFGPVYSWIQKPNGDIWWQFDYTIPGNAPGSYWAKHDPAKLKLGTTPSGDSANVNVDYSLLKNVPTWAWYLGGGLLLISLIRK